MSTSPAPRLRKTLKRQIPVWSLLLVLALGVAGGVATAMIWTRNQTTTSSPATPDFNISSSPASLSAATGSLATFTLTLSSKNGFAGSVDLDAILPAALSQAEIGLNPTSVSLFTGTGNSFLTVYGQTALPLGIYAVKVIGASGRLSHEVSMFLTITSPPGPDFVVSTIPSLPVASNSSGQSLVFVTSLNGFAGTVTLAANPPSGITASFGSANVTLTADQVGNSILTILVSSSTPSGNYNFSLTGTSGNLIRVTTQGVTVGDFSLRSSRSSMTINEGDSSSATITFSSLGGFAGPVVLSTNAPSGMTGSQNPTSVNLSPSGTATSTLTVAVSKTFTPGIYLITVKGRSGALTRSVDIIVSVPSPDFAISANPTSITVTAGGSAASTITLTSRNNFAGNITLFAVVSPSTGSSTPVATLNPVGVTLVADGSETSILLVSTDAATAKQSYTVLVTGTSGGLSHTVVVTLIVQ